jgi:glycerol kinase
LADGGGVYCVPALVGLGAAWWEPYARGTIVGITRGTTKAHLVRAAVEAMPRHGVDRSGIQHRNPGGLATSIAPVHA